VRVCDGKTVIKTLKSALFDFYTVDLLSDAKSRQLEDNGQMNLSVKHPYVLSRGDCNGRLECEVNDIVLLLTFSDEQKVLDKLSMCVRSNRDNISTMYDVRWRHEYCREKTTWDWYENFNLSKISEIGSTLTAIVQEVRALQAVRSPVSSRMTGDCESWRRDHRWLCSTWCDWKLRREPYWKRSDHNQSATARNWAMISSTPSQRNNRFAVLSGTDDDHDKVVGQWNVQDNSRDRARSRVRGRRGYAPFRRIPIRRIPIRQNPIIYLFSWRGNAGDVKLNWP